MIVTHGTDDSLCLQRDKGQAFYRDSTLMRHAARILNARGHDVIVKDAASDGHLVAEGSYYIRDRKWKHCWMFGSYLIRSAYQDYNTGTVFLKYDSLQAA